MPKVEEREEGRLELMGVDIRRLGRRDRLVLGLALGSALKGFRHSSEEEESEDWIAQTALDLCLALDVVDVARSQLVGIATGGGSSEELVRTMIALGGVGVAALGRALRDVDHFEGEEAAEEGAEDGARVVLELSKGELSVLHVLCGSMGVHATDGSPSAIETWIKFTDDNDRAALGESILRACQDATKRGPTEGELNAALKEMYEKGGEANVVLNAKGQLTLDLIDLLGAPSDIQAGNRFHKWLALALPDMRISIAKELRADLAAKTIPANPEFDLEDAINSDGKNGVLAGFLEDYPSASAARLALAICEISPEAQAEVLSAWGGTEESWQVGAMETGGEA